MTMEIWFLILIGIACFALGFCVGGKCNMKRIFNYVNDLGYHKRLEVEDIPEDDRLHCLLFGNGELCGEGMLYRTEINQMLEHYGAKGRV